MTPERRAFILRSIREGNTQAQMADALGISHVAVCQGIHRDDACRRAWASRRETNSRTQVRTLVQELASVEKRARTLRRQLEDELISVDAALAIA